MKKENIEGRKYNLLKVIEDTGEIHVLCQCDCGTIKKVNRWHLMSGRIKSCGCLNRKQTAARLSEMRQNGRKKWLNNHTANKNNKTGVKGVCFNQRKQIYTAYLTRNGKRIFCKNFETLEEAMEARQKAEQLYKQKEQE